MKVKKIIIKILMFLPLILVILNIKELYRLYLVKSHNRAYLVFGDSGYMELNRAKNKNLLFLKKNIIPGSVGYFWKDPRNYDIVTTECKAFESSYYLYPSYFKTAPKNLKTPYDHIITEKYDLEDLELYLTFFDMNKDFAKIAENDELIIMKRNSTNREKDVKDVESMKNYKAQITDY